MAKKTSFSPLKNFLFSLLSLVLILALIEAGLQLAAFYIQNSERQTLLVDVDQSEDLRILCIGESTTSWGGAFSYPRQLQTKLQKLYPNKKIKVLNRGWAGIRTDRALKILIQNIHKYKPHITLLKMGINDHLGPVQAVNVKHMSEALGFSREEEFKAQVYTIKFVKILISNIRHRRFFKRMERLRYVIELFDHGDFEKIKEFFLNETYTDHMAALFLNQIIPGNNPENLKLAHEIFKISFKKFPKSVRLSQSYQLYAVATGNEEAIRVVEKDSRAIAAMNNKGSRGSDSAGRPGLAMYENKVTRANYLSAVRYITDLGSIAVAVQYPLLDSRKLNELLMESDTLVIDNQRPFKRAVQEYGWDKVFIDRFAIDFGHYTKLGASILAENVAQELIKNDLLFPKAQKSLSTIN